MVKKNNLVKKIGLKNYLTQKFCLKSFYGSKKSFSSVQILWSQKNSDRVNPWGRVDDKPPRKLYNKLGLSCAKLRIVELKIEDKNVFLQNEFQ